MELAQLWRSDKGLRHLEALMIVADKEERHIVTLGSALLTLVLVFGVCIHSMSAIVRTINIHSIFTSGFWYSAGESAESYLCTVNPSK